jgi:hypothetical protein
MARANGGRKQTLIQVPYLHQSSAFAINLRVNTVETRKTDMESSIGKAVMCSKENTKMTNVKVMEKCIG